MSIGDNSIIAANSVVSDNVTANSLYAGSPAIFKNIVIKRCETNPLI